MDIRGLNFRNLMAGMTEEEPPSKKTKYGIEDFDPETLIPIPTVSGCTSLFTNIDNVIVDPYDRNNCILCIHKLGDHYVTREKPYPEINQTSMDYIEDVIINSYIESNIDTGARIASNFFNSAIVEQYNTELSDAFKPIPKVTPILIKYHYEIHDQSAVMQLLKAYKNIGLVIDTMTTNCTMFVKQQGSNKVIFDQRISKSLKDYYALQLIYFKSLKELKIIKK